MIPSPVDKEPDVVCLTIGLAQFLQCSPKTNHPVRWHCSGKVLHPGPRHTLVSQGLIIKPSFSDAGLYTCETVEAVKGRVHRKTVIQYLVHVQDTDAALRSLEGAVIFLAAFACMLTLLTLGFHLKAKKQNHVSCGN